MDNGTSDDEHGSLTRRALLSATGSISGAAIIPGIFSARAEPASIDAKNEQGRLQKVALTINDDRHQLALVPMSTLADALRDTIGLTGTKIGCNHGQCGACTVHVEGRRVLACLTLAATCEGKAITTIEGLSNDDRLHPMQQAFIDQDAFQCGYCTPGQILSAVALVREGRLGSDDEIREYMSGNLCRCAAYPKILAAVRQGAAQMNG